MRYTRLISVHISSICCCRFVCVLCNEVVYTTYEARNHLHDKHPSLEEEAFTINGLLYELNTCFWPRATVGRRPCLVCVKQCVA